MVLVGNLIADFDYQTMSRVLRVPDEKYRDKVFTSIQENLTTLRRETGRTPAWDEMAGALIRRFEEVLGPLASAELPQAVRREADALAPRFLSEEWLLKKGKRTLQGRDVKIASNVTVVQRVHKAPGGLLRVLAELRDGRLHGVSLSGDFFCFPSDAVSMLESMLEGARLKEAEGILKSFSEKAETPGVTVSDWLNVLGAAQT